MSERYKLSYNIFRDGKQKVEEIKNFMIKEAESKHKKIYPCSKKKSFEDCFTKSKGVLFFWYNTEDNSTHVITKEIKKDK